MTGDYELEIERREREWVLAAERRIDRNRKNMRWDWMIERHRKNLLIFGFVALGIAVIALAVLLGTN